MMLKQLEQFDEFLAESFSGSITKRELRLSAGEVKIVKEKYPKAVIKECANNKPGQKKWYEVTIHQYGAY